MDFSTGPRPQTHFGRFLAPFWHHFGSFWLHFEGLGVTWGVAGGSWDQLGTEGGSQGLQWHIFDAKWRPQGPPGLPKWRQNGIKK